MKDNRLLPPGFDKTTAAAEIAVQGEAASDADFLAGQDKVAYRIAVGNAKAPFTVTATLWYQPLSYRWATNLGRYDSMETRRFSGYYQSMADSSALVMGKAESVSGQ